MEETFRDMIFAGKVLAAPVDLSQCYEAASARPTPTIPALEAASLLSPVEILYLSDEDAACHEREGAALRRMNIAEVRPAFLRDIWIAGWSVMELLPDDQLRHVPAQDVRLMPMSDDVPTLVPRWDGARWRDTEVRKRWRLIVQCMGAGRWRHLKMLGDPRQVDEDRGATDDVKRPAPEALYSSAHASARGSGITPYGMPLWLMDGHGADAIRSLQESELRVWSKYLRHRRFRFWTLRHQGDL